MKTMYASPGGEIQISDWAASCTEYRETVLGDIGDNITIADLL